MLAVADGHDPEYKPLIYSEGTVNVKILGSNGTIDGNGWAGGWYQERWKLKGWQKGPMMIGMHNVTGLEIANLTLRDGARWHIHPVRCKNVYIHDMHVFAPKHHGGHPLGGNDGIDPDSCRCSFSAFRSQVPLDLYNIIMEFYITNA